MLYSRDAETLLKRQPNFSTQAIAAGDPQPMSPLLRVRWRIEQIPTQLADVLKKGAAMFCDIGPEFGGGEFGPAL